MPSRSTWTYGSTAFGPRDTAFFAFRKQPPPRLRAYCVPDPLYRISQSYGKNARSVSNAWLCEDISRATLRAREFTGYGGVPGHAVSLLAGPSPLQLLSALMKIKLVAASILILLSTALFAQLPAPNAAGASAGHHIIR